MLSDRELLSPIMHWNPNGFTDQGNNTAQIQLQNNQKKQEGGGAHLPSLLGFAAEENVFPASCCELLK